MGVREGPGDPARRTHRCTRPWTTSSRPPTGSCGSCPAPTSATRAARATRASARTASIRRGSSSPRCTRTSPTSSPRNWISRSASSATGPDRSPRRQREWTGLPEGIAVAVGNVDAHVTVAAADAMEPGQLVAIMGTSTCHVMNSDVLRDVPGMCGVVDGGILERQLGIRGRAIRRGRHLRLVRRQLRPGELPRRGPQARHVAARVPHRARRPPAGRPTRTGRTGLAQRKPFGAGRSRTVRRHRSGRPWRRPASTCTGRCWRPRRSARG